MFLLKRPCIQKMYFLLSGGDNGKFHAAGKEKTDPTDRFCQKIPF